jgi:hypothetical protein
MGNGCSVDKSNGLTNYDFQVVKWLGDTSANTAFQFSLDVYSKQVYYGPLTGLLIVFGDRLDGLVAFARPWDMMKYKTTQETVVGAWGGYEHQNKSEYHCKQGFAINGITLIIDSGKSIRNVIITSKSIFKSSGVFIPGEPIALGPIKDAKGTTVTYTCPDGYYITGLAGDDGYPIRKLGIVIGQVPAAVVNDYPTTSGDQTMGNITACGLDTIVSRIQQAQQLSDYEVNWQGQRFDCRNCTGASICCRDKEGGCGPCNKCQAQFRLLGKKVGGNCAAGTGACTLHNPEQRMSLSKRWLTGMLDTRPIDVPNNIQLQCQVCSNSQEKNKYISGGYQANVGTQTNNCTFNGTQIMSVNASKPSTSTGNSGADNAPMQGSGTNYTNTYENTPGDPGVSNPVTPNDVLYQYQTLEPATNKKKLILFFILFIILIIVIGGGLLIWHLNGKKPSEELNPNAPRNSSKVMENILTEQQNIPPPVIRTEQQEQALRDLLAPVPSAPVPSAPPLEASNEEIIRQEKLADRFISELST